MDVKWFNYAVSLTILMIMVNAFITIGSAQPNAQGKLNLFLLNNSNDAFSYSNQKTNSSFYIESAINSSSQSPTNEQNFAPIKRSIDDSPVGFEGFDAAVTMAFGLELVMLSLAGVFVVVAPLFWGIAAIAFLIKSVVIAWLGSLVIRSILGKVL